MAAIRKRRMHKNCRNCGAGLSGPYCSACGQRDADLNQPYWVFLEDAGEYFFSFESRFWKTLASLLARPGRMTRRFLEGRRARYVAPVRLFVIALVAFFLSLTLLDVALFKLSMIPAESVFDQNEKDSALAELDQKIEKAGGKNPKFTEILVTLRGEIAARPTAATRGGLYVKGDKFRYYPSFRMFVPLAEDQGEQVSEEMVGDFFNIAGEPAGAGWIGDFSSRVKKGFVRAAADPRRLNASLNTWLPRVMIVFVPLFAVFLWLFYWGRHHYLLRHLVFSVHFHTWLFLILTFFILAQAVWGGELSMTLFLIGVPLYLFFALKEVSGEGWGKTAAKAAVISVFYLFGFSVMLAAVFLMGLAEI
jgi:Protein of unknown function (DUF3667)